MTRLVLAIAACALLIPSVSSSQTEGLLNRLLAPGPLIKGHQNLERSDCLKCHESGKGISDAKCLDCHKEIRKFVEEKHGFHGMMTKSCIECHADHKGREFDTTTVDPKTFDHKLTGFSLAGKHAKLKCEDCHKEKSGPKFIHPSQPNFLGSQNTCVACHRKDDPHHFTGALAKKDCNACHSADSWHQDLKFDHDKDTHFKLVGKHAELKCADCHKNGKYKWPNLESAKCQACHENFHHNNLSAKFAGGNCTACHGQQTWKIEKFDHKVTGYPLRGKHAELKCSDCHKQKPVVNLQDLKHYHWAGLKADCLACHKDYHRFGGQRSQRFGNLNDCTTCHTERDWKETHNFNHSADTRFAIEGKHIPLDCDKCHAPENKQTHAKPAVGRYHWNDLSKKTCAACHTSPHGNDPRSMFNSKRCDQCHVAEDWHALNRNGKKFEHDKTRFKLDGKHAQINCSACHVVGRREIYKFTHVEQKFCVDCHVNPHTDQFHANFSSKGCYECHNTRTFTEREPFDHNQTAFVLKGAHAKLQCSECHTPTNDVFNTKPPHRKDKFLFPELPAKDCTTCHADYHNGQLGSKCSACHNDTSWKQVKFDHNTQSRFTITGKHIGVACEKCHTAVRGESVVFGKKRVPLIRFKPISPECTTCHKDPHSGHFGNRCQECHMDKGWKLTKDFHKNFTLSGVHFTLQCQECHRDNRRLSGMSEQCILCHQKDDIHQGTLPDCGKCHKQQFWEDVDFKHSLTRFPLRGAHRTLECAACHARGIYQGTPTQCISCHLANAQAAMNPVHTPISTFTNCYQCHNQFSFGP